MERLTTNKDVYEMSMIELAHNSCYAKDGKARYRDYDLDIDARELTRKLLKDHAESDDSFTDDEDFDDWMMDYLQDGMDSMEGLIALFYRNLWAMADLRERLKYYEDLEKQGKLLKLPCAVGDTVYRINKGKKEPIIPMRIIGIAIRNENELVIQTKDIADGNHNLYSKNSIGKTVFLTREAAEAALKELDKGE